MAESTIAIREITTVLTTDTDGTLHYRLGRCYQQNGGKRQGQEAFAFFTRLTGRAAQAKQKAFKFSNEHN